jgi:hypothetical protein
LDAQVLFFIKKNLGFGVVRLQDKNNKTHCFRVRDKEGLFKLISILNGNIFMETSFWGGRRPLPKTCLGPP